MVTAALKTQTAIHAQSTFCPVTVCMCDKFICNGSLKNKMLKYPYTLALDKFACVMTSAVQFQASNACTIVLLPYNSVHVWRLHIPLLDKIAHI